MKPQEGGPRCTSCGARGVWLCEECRVAIESRPPDHDAPAHPELERGLNMEAEEC